MQNSSATSSTIRTTYFSAPYYIKEKLNVIFYKKLCSSALNIANVKIVSSAESALTFEIYKPKTNQLQIRVQE